MTEPPAGPWVLVVGMHRSGTSAVTGALGALGLALPQPEDRMDWPESNPEHWESLSLSLHNEALLVAMGGSWDGPPDLAEGWEVELRRDHDPEALLALAYPTPGPSVWKDPRLCLLLPYWRSVLPAPLAVVFVWREPVAVARSLHQRDGMPISSGLALWERYNRVALAGLRGLDTFVIEYEAAIDNPSGFVDDVTGWLASLSQFRDVVGAWDVTAAREAIALDLLHQHDRNADDDLVVSAEQEALVDELRQLGDGHHPLEPGTLGVETAWTAPVVVLRRELGRSARTLDQALRGQEERDEELRVTRAQLVEADGHRAHAESDLFYIKRGLDAVTRELDRTKVMLAEANQQLADLHSSTSWRVTKPLRTSLAKLDKGGRRPTGH